ncbi:glutamine-synthetase adenylyltransferase [Sulfitobacter aestuarii]|uniref:Glutamine-synthetase adenylyltransferase n=1 Tax=Sulfitobacter aestuarii TaxID=2161676 RepID=A0ABW5U1E3_9RHOB
MTASSLAARLTRTPRPYHSGRARDAAALLGDLPPELAEVVIAAASISPYLMNLLEKETEWFIDACADPEAGLRSVIETVREPGLADPAEALRQGKRRVALLTGIADLGGVWELEEVTGALSDFADAACQAALRASLAVQLRRGKLPGLTEEDLASGGGMVVLAMGKMGARELNYSSDIDLICLFDETRFGRDDFHEARAGFVRATRAMSGMLSDITAGGYVFRTDLRLRPDSGVTPVCMAMEAAERYYESLGRTWERAAYIKARPCAGDLAAGEKFLATLRPFVWRRHLDFAAIQDAHDMRLAIREHKGLGGPITLSGHDMKLGRGGIREIEFFTQTRQLIAGGRDVDLRLRGTLPALQVLARKGWVPEDAVAALGDHYRAHRGIEHRLQMIQDAQTHALPRSEAGFDRLACMVDMDTEALKADLVARLNAVHELTEGFFAASREPTPLPLPGDHQFDAAVIDRWLSYPALRSPRAAAIFARLKPDLLARLAEAGRPDEALRAFDGFLAGLPAGVQLFSLLKVNPQLADLLIDIVSTSPALARHLSQNAGVLDAVLGGDFFSPWPGQAALQDMLEETLAHESDYETRLDGTRRWAREWHFRIGVHHLRGLIDADRASVQYADLARAVLSVLWPVVTAQFALRHGPPPGRGAVLLGMGSLGAGRLTATSDLDMIVIYDPQEQEMSEGRRPLATRAYYARLTQAMITALSAPMAEGRLYEVDMRLRPSGNQGPVATSLASFKSYQMTEAWIWEHLALTRAQVIAGPQDLAQDVETLRRQILQQPRARHEVLAQVAQMRARIAAAKSGAGPLDAKIGPGRLQDIELFAQAGTLISGRACRDIGEGIAALPDAGVIGPREQADLAAAYGDCWTLQCAARLLSSAPLDPETLGAAGIAFLCRTLQHDDLESLLSHMSQKCSAAATIIDRALREEAPGQTEDDGP